MVMEMQAFDERRVASRGVGCLLQCQLRHGMQFQAATSSVGPKIPRLAESCNTTEAARQHGTHLWQTSYFA